MSPNLVAERSGRPDGKRTRAGPWLRTRVFLSRLRLDRALAKGTDPSTSPDLSLRAEQLQRPKTRERIAKGIDRLTALAFDDPRRHVGPAMLPFRHQRVKRNLDGFAELAEALRSTAPHEVKGLAMASTLLEDGRGPLYGGDPGEKLQVALSATISDLKGADERSG